MTVASGVSHRLLGRLIAEGYLRRATDRMSPALTGKNKVARLQFVLSHLDEDMLTFDPGYDVVHVDENWFNEDKDDRAYFSLDDEMPSSHSRESKRFIPRPCFSPPLLIYGIYSQFGYLSTFIVFQNLYVLI